MRYCLLFAVLFLVPFVSFADPVSDVKNRPVNRSGFDAIKHSKANSSGADAIRASTKRLFLSSPKMPVYKTGTITRIDTPNPVYKKFDENMAQMRKKSNEDLERFKREHPEAAIPR